MLLRTSAICGLLLLVALSRLTAQVSFTINPSADAFVTTGPPGNDRSNNNYGGAGALAVSGSGSVQGEFQSLMRFNLASTIASFNTTYGTGHWMLQSITLQVTAQPPANPIFNTSSAGAFGIVWQVNDSWTEGTGTPNGVTMDGVTFSNLESMESGSDASVGTFSTTGATSGSFTYSLSLVQSFTGGIMAGGDVSLRLFAADNNVSFVVNSRSFGTASARPILTITAIPEPGVNALLVIGAGVLIAAGRRCLTSRPA